MAESQLTLPFLPVKSNRRNYVGEANPNWKGAPIDKMCARCNTQFRVAYGNRKARFCTLECFNIWQRENHVGKGRPKKARVTVSCLRCSKEFSIPPSHVERRKFCCSQCHFDWRSDRMVLDGNPRWEGGLAKFPYPPTWGMERRKIVARDGGRCQNPLCWGTSAKINVHHIDYDKNHCEPANLITLCVSCNSRANNNRPWWETHYVEIMRARGLA
jgi:hypothetical protein